MIPHFAFPFQIAGTSAVVLEQDSIEEVAQSVQIVLMTRIGSRVELPSFGIRDLTFDIAIPYAEILGALEQWEPRAHTIISDNPDRLDNLIRTIIAEVSSIPRGGG